MIGILPISKLHATTIKIPCEILSVHTSSPTRPCFPAQRFAVVRSPNGDLLKRLSFPAKEMYPPRCCFSLKSQLIKI